MPDTTPAGGWPRLLISRASPTQRVPRPSRTLRRAGVGNACASGWITPHDPGTKSLSSLPRLFQNREKGIAAARGAQKRQSAVAGGSDKVQVMSAVGAMQAAGHNNSHGTGSIVPAPSASSGQALATNARAGHPQFRNGKEETRKGGPPARSSPHQTRTQRGRA